MGYLDYINMDPVLTIVGVVMIIVGILGPILIFF